MNNKHMPEIDAIATSWTTNSPSCDAPTHAGSPCRRPAAWVINLHGCEHVLMCSQHKAAWVTDVERRRAGSPRCVHCGRVFPNAHAAITVTAL